MRVSRNSKKQDIMKVDLQKFSLINQNGNFQIEMNPEIEIPKSLYKYYYLNKNSLNVLKENYLHFAHSFTMNDIMDGNFLLWDTESFVDQMMKLDNIPESEKIANQKDFMQICSDEFLKYIGIFCACENYSNDLLWSHYTNEKGFCIELDTSNLLQSLQEYKKFFFPINYGELSQINLLDFCYKRVENGIVNADANIPIFYSLANKDFFWNYEKEWRVIIRDETFEKITNPQIMLSEGEQKIENENLKKRNILIPENVFKKIILSPLFFNNNRFQATKFNRKEVKYFFSEGDEKTILIDFFKTLKEKYNDKIFQINKYLGNGKILRDITYHILILEVNDDYVELVRKNFCYNSTEELQV